ncbi:hypothetical protein PG985_009760 [Apiospora marii]|uniref:uncharacterized protein n=1 Tax=Apiospora marii TaxID=335849 RepID=UPI00312DE0F9
MPRNKKALPKNGTAEQSQAPEAEPEAAICESGNQSERVTGPGDDTLVAHTVIHQSDHRLAYYLGYTSTWHLKRAMYSPRVLHATRLLKPFLEKVFSEKHMNHVFQEWRRHKDDETFREEYRVDESKIRDYGKTGKLNVPTGPKNADSIRARCEAFVWGLEFLSAAAGTHDPVWTTAKGEEEAYPESYERLIPTMIGEDKEGVLPLIPWNEETRPELVHYPEFNEIAFEKYLRLLALIRGCNRRLLTKFELAKTHKRLRKEVEKVEKTNGGQRLTLQEKRNVMMQQILTGRDTPSTTTKDLDGW